jgi:hypothetical protein
MRYQVNYRLVSGLFNVRGQSIAARILSHTRAWIGGSESIKRKEFIDLADWGLVRDLDRLDSSLRSSPLIFDLSLRKYVSSRSAGGID